VVTVLLAVGAAVWPAAAATARSAAAAVR
jgi:hypothetical protein